MNAGRKLDVVIHALGLPFDGETIKTASLGGSESAAYYQARELAARGHRVFVFSNCLASRVSDGVTYIPAGEVTPQTPLGRDFEHYARHTPHDVLIIQRHPLAFQEPFASTLNVWQLHDLALTRYAPRIAQMLWNIDVITVVSEWHKAQVCAIYGVREDSVQVVRNGVDPKLYNGPLDFRCAELSDNQSFRMLYQSRPERGLEHLVRPGGIMHRLLRDEPRARLFIAGYTNPTPATSELEQRLMAWARALPNVTLLGALAKSHLADVQAQCHLLCYPTEFEEVSCITAMEAMHAGLPLLSSDVGALSETCHSHGARLLPLKEGVADEDAFVAAIGELINAPEVLERMCEPQLDRAANFSWAAAVDGLERLMASELDARRGTALARAKHCIEHSDIALASVELAADTEGANNVAADIARSELDELYAFAQSADAYAAHYAKHQGAYYDGPGARAIGEDVTQTTRFRAVLQLIGTELTKLSETPRRVLDYGCAHGHYLIPLAKEFSTDEFIGVDISERAIGAALKWAQRDGVGNVELVVGSHELLAEGAKVTSFDDGRQEWLCPRRKLVREEVDPLSGDMVRYAEFSEPELFDVILAGEVVEHVPDYLELLERLRLMLKPNGLLVITTPYGRWEWSGTQAFREAREHLWHFERKDIVEICGQNRTELLFAPAGHDAAAGALGSWVWGVRNDGFVFSSYDVERKRRALIPARETVSACLIVKDGERTLRRCVESFIDWVDEVIVAVDPSTTDRTRLVLEQLQSDFHWRAIRVLEGAEALKDGFHTARNKTLEAASCDWVLWLDADEEVQRPWGLWKYLRKTQHPAYGFPQVHYACDPPQVLTTDYPCRLFRRDAGVRFYGFVHEHPETAPGKAIPHATIRHDVQFLHAGYVDEATRRKRYERNLPLLARDMKEFPTRRLNSFLWLRDIAQGIAFFAERSGGIITEAQIEQAREGIKLFESMLEQAIGGTRMLIDAVQFYSQCVMAIGEGFDAELTFATVKEPYVDHAARCSVKGRFHTSACFERLASKLLGEGARKYSEKYF